MSRAADERHEACVVVVGEERGEREGKRKMPTPSSGVQSPVCPSRIDRRPPRGDVDVHEDAPLPPPITVLHSFFTRHSSHILHPQTYYSSHCPMGPTDIGPTGHCLRARRHGPGEVLPCFLRRRHDADAVTRFHAGPPGPRPLRQQ
jgi:hypothetical protein